MQISILILSGNIGFVLNKYSWEIPEGGGEPDEDPLVAVKRELLEEAGIVAEEWKQILTMHLSNSVSDELAILYLADAITVARCKARRNGRINRKKNFV